MLQVKHKVISADISIGFMCKRYSFVDQLTKMKVLWNINLKMVYGESDAWFHKNNLIINVGKTIALSVRRCTNLMQTILLWFYSHKWPLHVSDIYMSIFRSSYIQVVSLPHVVFCPRCCGCGPTELVCSHVHCLSVSFQLTDKQCTRLHNNSAGP